MKTLKNHVILYDNDCPMCNVYTGAFIKAKWLNDDGRLPYQHLDDTIATEIDMDRAKDEIALYDLETKTTHYGIDSLFTIIGNGWPVFKPLFHNTVFRWMIKRLYRLITYNRKVIAAVKPKGTGRFTCAPAFNLKYRLVYLLLSLMFVGWIYSSFAHLIVIYEEYSFLNMILFLMVQVALQSTVAALTTKDKLTDYLGNLMTVHIIGALLLTPAFLVAKIFDTHGEQNYLYYALAVFAFMIVEHQRRVKLLHTTEYATLTWVLGSVLSYILIFYVS